MTDAAKLDFAIRYLRRTNTLGQITTVANLVGAALLAGKTKIAITNSNMEGGGAGGQIEFEAAITGQACEALLAQAAAAGLTDGSATIPTARRRIAHRVRLGPGCYPVL